MKRMKNLLALVMAVVMVLALGIPALAAGSGGDIYVAEAGAHTYQVYKIFDLEGAGTNDYVYKFTSAGTEDSALLTFLQSYPDLVLTETGTGTGIYTVKKSDTFSAADFAAKLATVEADISAARHVITDATTTDSVGKQKIGKVTADGYYFITYDNGKPYALTTVDSKDIQIQNKHDTPFDKDVWAETPNYTIDSTTGEFTGSIDRESVEYGQKLHYAVIGEVPAVSGNTQYEYVVWDKLHKGLQLDTATGIKVYIAPKAANGDINQANKTLVTMATDTVNTTPVTSTPKDTIWYNTNTTPDANGDLYSDTKPAFVVNIDVARLAAENPSKVGYAILIEYDATVTEDVGVLVNTAHLVSNDLIKDAQTQNYDSKITVDKFETGNASQKLAGAEFVLYRFYDTDADKSTTIKVSGTDTTVYEFKNAAGQILYNTAANKGGTWYNAEGVAQNSVTATDWTNVKVQAKEYYSLHDNKVNWVKIADAATEDATLSNLQTLAMETVPANDTTHITKVVTQTDGSAEFTGLKDGIYYLEEIKAPNGYVRLDTPVEVTVNGSASLNPNNTVDNNPTATEANQQVQLRNVAQVANTPGSVLPSTGGRGTTMLYMAGLGMMLAAGAFLIFRRRAEAGK